MLCEWPQPIPLRWETLEVDTSTEVSDKSVQDDPPASMRSVVSTLGRQPRVCDLMCEYPPDFGSLTRQDADTSKLKELFEVKYQHFKEAQGT